MRHLGQYSLIGNARKTRKRKTRKAKGQRSLGKHKQLYSDCKHDAGAKRRGDIYKSGSAFPAKVSMEVAPVIVETQNEDVAEQQSTIPRQQDTEPVQKHQHKCKVIPQLPPGMAPGTRYCLWCDTWGHEHHSFTKCGQNPEVLARKAAEEAAAVAKAKATEVPKQD